MKRSLVALVLACALLLGLSGCAEPAVEETFFALDTYVTFKVYGSSESLSVAKRTLVSLEERWSNTLAGSEITALNQAEGSCVAMPEDTREMFRMAQLVSERTGGAFDCTVEPVVEAYGFYSGDFRVPDEAELAELLEKVNYQLVCVNNTIVQISENQRVDLGGIAKGAIGDICARTLRQQGVESAILSLGGNVCAVGKKPNGEAFSVAVTDPKNPEDYLGTVLLDNASLVTSGGYQRYFDLDDGTRVHHILDPRTGKSAASGLQSVTVLSQSGAKADALSTALFVLGEQGARDYFREYGDVELILVTDDSRVLVTEGLSENFRLAEGSSYTLEIVRK